MRSKSVKSMCRWLSKTKFNKIRKNESAINFGTRIHVAIMKLMNPKVRLHGKRIK